MADFDNTNEAGTVERVEDLGRTPSATVKRWLLELRIADKEEKKWRERGQRVLDRYRNHTTKKNSFNILWSNTETLRPAVYNSLPKPDVRRRYRDKDPLGKVASQVTSRCLEYAIDTTAFDDVIKQDILDALLPGRGVSRVRYVPAFSKDGDAEELAWEQVDLQHVQWDDFRRGPGKTWDEVRWVGFRHRMTREDLVNLNPEVGELIELDNVSDEDVKKADSAVADMFKTCEVWEIWCKEERTVYFVTEAYKAAPIKEQEDPLNLLGFFPIPRPLYAIEDASSLIPVTLFELYEEQANELDALTARISRIVKGLKLRGVYDATIPELSQVMRGDDNDLIPAANVSQLVDRGGNGGLDKFIWMMPIKEAAEVLNHLYSQREQIKQTIYEITGISDILRGSTDAGETATAQQIKNKWGTLRVQRIQQEVQRYIRDLFRLMSEIIGEKFSPETLVAQSLLPPEAVMQALPLIQSDMLREFHIDVETDSTVASTLETDMKGLQEVIGGIVQFITGIGPAVQMKAIPIEAAKEIIMAVVRRSKLGNAVEDALDGMQEPQAPGGIDPEQVQQMQEQMQQQMQQLQQQLQQAQQATQQAEQKAQQLQTQMQQDQSKLQADMAINNAKLAADERIALYQADRALEQAIKIAMINAGAKVEATEITAAANKEAKEEAAEQAGPAREE